MTIYDSVVSDGGNLSIIAFVLYLGVSTQSLQYPGWGFGAALCFVHMDMIGSSEHRMVFVMPDVLHLVLVPNALDVFHLLVVYITLIVHKPKIYLCC